MKKISNRGFMLAETLVVTTFVSGVLIFLFIQFTNLSKNYNESYMYNTIDDLYSLRNIRDYVISDTSAFSIIEDTISNNSYIEITDCSVFSQTNYCLTLFELENIDKIFISNNEFDKDLFFNYDDNFKKFINRINPEGTEKYRILAQFNDFTYATIRFGEMDE